MKDVIDFSKAEMEAVAGAVAIAIAVAVAAPVAVAEKVSWVGLIDKKKRTKKQ